MDVTNIAILRSITLNDACDGDTDSCGGKAISNLQSSTLCQRATDKRRIASREKLTERASKKVHARCECHLGVNAANAAKHHDIKARTTVRHCDLHWNRARNARNLDEVVGVALRNLAGKWAETICAIDDESSVAFVGGGCFAHAAVDGAFGAEQKNCNADSHNGQRGAQTISSEHAQRK